MNKRILLSPMAQGKGPKLGFFDIETAPVLGNVWGLFKQNVGLNQIHKDWYILSYAFNTLGTDHISYKDQRHAVDIEDDSALVIDLWHFLNDHDIVVAHNGRRFDVKKCNARFLSLGLPPPSPYKILDTLEVMKKRFALTSNKLEYATDLLCQTKKLKHGKFPGFELWKECLKGNLEAWQEMEEYNRVDVIALRELYFVLLPWMDLHPNVGNYVDAEVPVCPKCGSDELTKRGIYHTQVAQYQKYQCGCCGGWSRGRTLVNTLAARKLLMTGISE